MNPKITVIVPTYNRSHSITRTLDSIFVQTFKDFEIVVVDDGSTDNTKEILDPYRIYQNFKVVNHDTNKGAVAAKNTGFDEISGEWFCILDSDDEIVPDAFERLFEVLVDVDPTINAVTCNCLDTATGEFSGKGLSGSGYLGAEEIILKATGEFWGMTKTSLLGKMRFNEDHHDHNILWYKINAVANRYYLHEALRLYHTAGSDRVTHQIKEHQRDVLKTAASYRVLSKETFYLGEVEKYNPRKFLRICLHGFIANKIVKDKDISGFYKAQLKSQSDLRFLHRFLLNLIFLTPAPILRSLMPYKKRLWDLVIR